MPRRPSLSCRQFRQLHAEYVDGYLCGERTEAMRAHGDDCAACSTLDVSVRRSLLALQTLPTIEPSADFRERLHERLELSQVTERAPRRLRIQAPMRGIRWGLASVVTAASVAFLVLAAPSKTGRPVSPRPAPTLARASMPAAPALPVARVAPVLTVPAPVAPARVDVVNYAAQPAESFRFEALPGVTAVRRSPSMLASPSVRLQLASFSGQ
ncbi:MAG: zf-HC2 domain-containing protein [Gemmatimonadaceae bacterium]